jgi:hypothetical protein
MDPECFNSIDENGFLIETWSGDDTTQICSVRGQPPIRHYVKVYNVRLYEARKIKCEGFIDSQAPVLVFQSNNPNDSITYWSHHINNLRSGDTYTFNPCVLQAVDGAIGKERLDAVVAVDWPPPIKRETFKLGIDVNTD